MPVDFAASADARRVADGLSDAEWERLIVQLGRYAQQKSRRFYWRTGGSGELPEGERIQSIVSKAIVLWLDGTRRWSRAEYVDLQHFLMGVIDSLLSHAARSYDNRGFETRDRASDDDRATGPVTPERALLDRERAAEADAMLRDIIARSEQDAVVLDIIDAIRNGAGTRREIVVATGHPADVIDNGLKRLRRIGASVARSKTHELQQAR